MKKEEIAKEKTYIVVEDSNRTMLKEFKVNFPNKFKYEQYNKNKKVLENCAINFF